jgi:hypothetical protein
MELGDIGMRTSNPREMIGQRKFAPVSHELMKMHGGAVLHPQAEKQISGVIGRAFDPRVQGQFNLPQMYQEGIGENLARPREAGLGGSSGLSGAISQRASRVFESDVGELKRELDFKGRMDQIDLKEKELELGLRLAIKRSEATLQTYNSYLKAKQQHKAAKAKNLGSILGVIGTIGGAVVGGIFGGPAGAAAGGAVGGAVGGAAGNTLGGQ